MDVQLNLVDLNTAEPVELRNVPGIGSKLADRIIAARPYSDLIDLRRVSGVGPALFEQLKPYVTVSPSTGSALQSETIAPAARPDTPVFRITPPAAKRLKAGPRPALPLNQSSELPKSLPAEAPAIKAEPLATLPVEPILNSSEAELSEPIPVNPLPATPAVVSTLPGPLSTPPLPPVSPGAVLLAQPEIKGVTRAELYGIAAASGVFSFILAVLFTLLFLGLINGGLRFVKPAEINQLASQVNTINAQANELSGEIGTLKNSLTGVGGLDGRVTSVEQDARQLRTDLDAVSGSADTLSKRIDDLSFQVDALVARTGRFQNFLDNLRNLLDNLNQSEVK